MSKRIVSKKSLAVALSRISGFESPQVKIEQYQTNSDIAADMLWNAYMDGKVSDKVVADLGCGTGIIGIGALLLGARKVYFVDVDEEALKKAKEHYENLKNDGLGDAGFFPGRVEEFNAADVEVVVQNPPFGTKEKHADKVFLEKAFELCNLVYSFHKVETLGFLEAVSKDNGFRITRKYFYEFPIKKTMKHHEKPVKKINVVVCVFEKL